MIGLAVEKEYVFSGYDAGEGACNRRPGGNFHVDIYDLCVQDV